MIEETAAEIRLLLLIDLTLRRIVSIHKNTFIQQVEENDVLHAVFKWGCDGNSGHSMYK